MTHLAANLDVVNPVNVREIGANAGASQPPALAERNRLIRGQVPAGIVTHLVLPEPRADGENGRTAKQMDIAGRDVPGEHTLALILAREPLIVGIRDLEPVASEAQIQVQ